MNEELKPCPFCGGKPELRRPNGYRVECLCGAEKEVYDEPLEAIAAWNRRAPTDSSKQIEGFTSEPSQTEAALRALVNRALAVIPDICGIGALDEHQDESYIQRGWKLCEDIDTALSSSPAPKAEPAPEPEKR